LKLLRKIPKLFKYISKTEGKIAGERGREAEKGRGKGAGSREEGERGA